MLRSLSHYWAVLKIDILDTETGAGKRPTMHRGPILQQIEENLPLIPHYCPYSLPPGAY